MSSESATSNPTAGFQPHRRRLLGLAYRMLGSMADAEDEEYVGPWLPEPVVDTAALAPDSCTELAEDLSIALLLTLDRLSPLERAAFLLREVFDFSFSEV